MPEGTPVVAHILCLPESAGSTLYGMVDVLSATGTLWQELTGCAPVAPLIRPRLVSLRSEPFTCGNGIPVMPEQSISEVASPEIVILPELWLAPDDDLSDRYDELKAWLRACHDGGAILYSACSGSVLLAASGLLDGLRATSHWGYADLFQRAFPRVRFDPAPALCIGDASARIVTAGGTSSWHDLALHIISRHASPGEALRIAKVYLMKWHGEGQSPFRRLVRRHSHADSVVRAAEDWLAAHFREDHVLAAAVAASMIPERSLKRRFKAATGSSLIAQVQNLRIEEAKRLLERDLAAADEIAALVGYDNAAFFRRIFRRGTGLTPGEYRPMFRPLAEAGDSSMAAAPA
jgi:transcriptional regulator GlxA family with amidase domain